MWFEPLLSLAVIHPPQKSKGFYAVGCTFPASPFSAGEPSSPVNPPRPFLPACNIAQSPYRFLCACVLLLSIFHPFPHVFLMCSRTHIVLILPLSHPVCVCVCGVGTRTWLTNGTRRSPSFLFFIRLASASLHNVWVRVKKKEGGDTKNSCLRQFYIYNGSNV